MRTIEIPPLSAPTVVGRVRECIHYLHYSYQAEKAYVFWIRKFLKFHGMKHPSVLGPSEVQAYLTWLADEQRVSAATHRQALAAILFLYRRVLQSDLPWLDSIGRPRQRHRLPVVLSRDEVARAESRRFRRAQPAGFPGRASERRYPRPSVGARATLLVHDPLRRRGRYHSRTMGTRPS